MLEKLCHFLLFLGSIKDEGQWTRQQEIMEKMPQLCLLLFKFFVAKDGRSLISRFFFSSPPLLLAVGAWSMTSWTCAAHVCNVHARTWGKKMQRQGWSFPAAQRRGGRASFSLHNSLSFEKPQSERMRALCVLVCVLLRTRKRRDEETKWGAEMDRVF